METNIPSQCPGQVFPVLKCELPIVKYSFADHIFHYVSVFWFPGSVLYSCLSLSLSLYIYMCVCVCVCMYIYTYIYVCMYVYMYVCIYMYIYTYTHTHTPTCLSQIRVW